MTDQLLIDETASISPPAGQPEAGKYQDLPSIVAALSAVAKMLEYCCGRGVWNGYENKPDGTLAIVFRNPPADVLARLDSAIGQCVRAGIRVNRVAAQELIFVIHGAQLTSRRAF